MAQQEGFYAALQRLSLESDASTGSDSPPVADDGAEKRCRPPRPSPQPPEGRRSICVCAVGWGRSQRKLQVAVRERADSCVLLCCVQGNVSSRVAEAVIRQVRLQGSSSRTSVVSCEFMTLVAPKARPSPGPNGLLRRACTAHVQCRPPVPYPAAVPRAAAACRTMATSMRGRGRRRPPPFWHRGAL